MPRKPKRPCSYPGCPKLTDGRFCEEHQRREGRLVKAEQVHHIKPLAEGGDHSETNLMSLCSSCHAKIHAERGDRWHNH